MGTLDRGLRWWLYSTVKSLNLWLEFIGGYVRIGMSEKSYRKIELIRQAFQQREVENVPNLRNSLSSLIASQCSLAPARLTSPIRLEVCH